MAPLSSLSIAATPTEQATREGRKATEETSAVKSRSVVLCTNTLDSEKRHMDGVKLPPGAVLAALTQDELVEAAADAVSLSSLEDTPSSARLSSQDRGKKQKNRLRKKITDEAAKSTAELAAIPISSDKSAPEIIERFKRGQRVNLQRHSE